MMKIDEDMLFEQLLSSVMGAEKSEGYRARRITETSLSCSLIDLYEPKYKSLAKAESRKRIDKTQIKSWRDVLDMGIPRYLQNETPSYKLPYISAHKKTWGFDRVEWPQDTSIDSLILGSSANHKNWANMVAHALLGCAYSRTPLDIGIDDGDDLYLFHFIRVAGDKFGAQTHAYKLGRSKDPEKRRASLSGSSGCVVLPMLVLKGAGFLEPLVHKAMSDREIKDPASEFYDDYQMLSLLACLALIFQKHTQQSLIEVLRDNLDVCAARFPVEIKYDGSNRARLHDAISQKYMRSNSFVNAVESLFYACHPSHMVSDSTYLNSVAPMQDIEMLEKFHLPLGVLAAFIGEHEALGISSSKSEEHAERTFRSVFGDDHFGLHEGVYWFHSIASMPTLSFNAFVRLCTSFRLEVFKRWGFGDGHDITAQSICRRKLSFLRSSEFVKIMMEVMPEVLRLAETKVDMFDICESIAKAVQDDQ